MRLSGALTSVCLCVASLLCAQAGTASAPGNRAAVERIETKQVNGGRGFGGWSKLVFDQSSGLVECGALRVAERRSVRGAERGGTVRHNMRHRARKAANICALPKLID